RDRADTDLTAEMATDHGFELGAPAFGVVLEERLGLREPERHDVAIDRDRPAFGQDRPRRRSHRAHDRRPIRHQAIEGIAYAHRDRDRLALGRRGSADLGFRLRFDRGYGRFGHGFRRGGGRDRLRRGGGGGGGPH